MISRRTFVAGAAATLVAAPRFAIAQKQRRIAFTLRAMCGSVEDMNSTKNL